MMELQTINSEPEAMQEDLMAEERVEISDDDQLVVKKRRLAQAEGSPSGRTRGAKRVARAGPSKLS